MLSFLDIKPKPGSSTSLLLCYTCIIECLPSVPLRGQTSIPLNCFNVSSLLLSIYL